MKLLIDIPKEFEQHFQADRLDDSLHRLSADAHLLAGLYEQETAMMLSEALKNAVIVPPHGRLIDADALKKACQEEVRNIPAADVVEVVRCKDCKYSDTFPADGEVPEMPLKCIGIRYGGVMGDWYCEHGERRANDAKG